MGVIENLGALPRLLTAEECFSMKCDLLDGRISPNDEDGYFDAEGRFILVLPSHVFHMWSPDLLGLDDQYYRLLKTSMDHSVHVYDKRDQGEIITFIRTAKVENIRKVVHEQSGLSIVSNEGLVLPPKVNGQHEIRKFHFTTEKLLAEIQRGEDGFSFGGRDVSFERIDPSLAGKEVMQISLQMGEYKEDRVIIYDGKLLERSRVFPFISR